jgi:hypothetical protein
MLAQTGAMSRVSAKRIVRHDEVLDEAPRSPLPLRRSPVRDRGMGDLVHRIAADELAAVRGSR